VGLLIVDKGCCFTRNAATARQQRSGQSAFNQESGNTMETDVEIIALTARSIANLYLARMRSNYAAQGEAYGQDELIKSDMFVCQIVAELALATVGDLDQ
jgi:hypothetical protein